MLEHVDFQFAEAAAECDLPRGRQILVASDDDGVRVVDAFELLKGALVEIASQIHADDFRAGRPFGSPHFE
jgi:hypothetical protein